jgi:hypothetical protein
MYFRMSVSANFFHRDYSIFKWPHRKEIIIIIIVVVVVVVVVVNK